MEVKTAPEISTKTFKEVHADLEHEQIFLQQNHDVSNFKKKADFLSSIGFQNSIATKLYSSIAENNHFFRDYEKKYFGLYKFLLEPQIERICEKYNLYVRDLQYFLGDIPEDNIIQIMNFSVCLDDIKDYHLFYTNNDFNPYQQNKLVVNSLPMFIKNNMEHLILTGYSDYLTARPEQVRIPITSFKRFGLTNLLTIASVESLLSPNAFLNSRNRIESKPELAPKHKVELDPIVLFKTAHGYLVITAWGDEANDELVANPKMN
jgi:hypothetical protein